ncbi:MAG TPA: hypothetical protein PLE74_12515 [Candidatus Cloacimonadota bacterium]|nr:hypothetical protein [Candidatus Cloacimonadota bacterium]HPT73091.1 hypothetical protein [Candidatus Cloacimonadota bacterium]
MSKFKEIDLSKLNRYSISDRLSKVNEKAFAQVQETELSSFWNSVPQILKASEMQELLNHCAEAVRRRKPIIVGMGGHVIKCGLAPLLIKMINMGVIKGILSNNSVVIHDYEIAHFGNTSEDVTTALADGSFGMAIETADGINHIITKASEEGLGYGEAVGKAISESDAPYKDKSILAAAYQKQIPFTVHVAVGTDIIHQHASADGKAIGDCSLRDFRIFCNSLIELNDGGVFLNFGSAVILPEVFLKAITVVRNLGYPLKDFYTAVFDMNMHYRPQTNVVDRPTMTGGKGYYFVGHHEIMIPLFLLSLREKILGK